MGTVDIPALNLKIANWFHQGMVCCSSCARYAGYVADP